MIVKRIELGNKGELTNRNPLKHWRCVIAERVENGEALPRDLAGMFQQA